MSIKRMSLRFNLDNESDRKAWEHLQSVADSKNKSVIDSLNASFEQANSLADLIRQTIRECLSAGTFVPADISSQTEEPEVSEDEAALLDAMDAFMGD
jgi:hypothetical protein